MCISRPPSRDSAPAKPTSFVDKISIELKSPSKTCRKRPRRTIRFAPSLSRVVCHVPRVQEISEAEKHRTWWSAEESAYRRNVARNSGCLSRAQGGSVLWKFQEAKQQAQDLAARDEVDEDKLNETLRDLDGLGAGLKEWCTGCNSRRGLERWTSEQRIRVHFSKSLTADQICKRSQRLSRHARIFARFMGEADAAAASRAASSRTPP